MKRFHCACGQEVFFEDSVCSACGRLLGFSPLTLEMLTVMPQKKQVTWVNRHRERLRACALRDHAVNCNWLIAKNDPNDQCCSCRLTHTIPAQNVPVNVQRWKKLEIAKRRLLYSLLLMDLPIVPRTEDPERGLRFDFLEDQRSNPLVKREFVYTGHNNGVITINVVEADDSYRVSTRERMNERYRTVLGHFRHESGHFFWDRLVRNTKWHARFRHLFGSEENYRQALDFYYSNGPAPDWQRRHISAYASSHPWEDWAESWAHYLHIMDTLETATHFGVMQSKRIGASGFYVLMRDWWQLKFLMNSLNRSMGLPDAYPCPLTNKVMVKLRFIHQIITESNRV